MKVLFKVKLRPTEWEEEVEIPDGFTQQQIEMRCKYWVRNMLERAVEQPTIDVHHIVIDEMAHANSSIRSAVPE